MHLHFQLLIICSFLALSTCDEADEDIEQPSETVPVDTPTNGLDNGFGEKIKWMTHEDGFRELHKGEKLMMLIFHQSWCGACKELKRVLATSEQFEILSQHFIMVNVEGDITGNPGQYQPDGVYFPRIYFLDSKRKVLTNIYNKNGNPKYKYYYGSEDKVTTGMYLAMSPDTFIEEDKNKMPKHEEF